MRGCEEHQLRLFALKCKELHYGNNASRKSLQSECFSGNSFVCWLVYQVLKVIYQEWVCSLSIWMKCEKLHCWRVVLETMHKENYLQSVWRFLWNVHLTWHLSELSIKLCIEYDNHNKSLISNCREFVVGSVKVYKSYWIRILYPSDLAYMKATSMKTILLWNIRDKARKKRMVCAIVMCMKVKNG